MHIHLDFETYSEAGFDFRGGKWRPLPGVKNRTGIKAVGTVPYCEHPSAEILSMAYSLNNTITLWVPGDPLPQDLFNAVYSGAKIHAWNSIFEYYVWNLIGVKKYGFPEIFLNCFRCSMAQARAYALPGALKEAAKVLNLTAQKKEGTALLHKFSVPKNASKTDPRLRRYLMDYPDDQLDFYEYNVADVQVERLAHNAVPDLNVEELNNWRIDQRINTRGIAIDLPSVEAFIKIVEIFLKDSEAELVKITNGRVKTANQAQELRKYIHENFGVTLPSMNKATVAELLTGAPLPPVLKRILEIRRDASKSSVKKLYALKYRTSASGRLKNMYVYYGARTGRASGSGVQPQNIPSASVNKTVDRIVDEALTMRPIAFITKNPDTLKTVSACLRGMFIAPPGKLLIVSDYSAIEAVVLAVIAGEQWRIEVFKTHGKIYEESVSRVTGTPLEEILQYRQAHGEHHPLRKFGKVVELASGYQGGPKAWERAGALEFIAEQEIINSVKKWRRANAAIVSLWYRLEECAVKAVRAPNQEFKYRDITYMRRGDVLFCKLPSGRELVYHKIELDFADKLSFEMWNTNQNYGKLGWVRVSTYGGKLVENVVQAVARDVLMNALNTLENNGFPVVLHTHDEVGCEMDEIPESEYALKIAEFEALITQLPAWASTYPIKAAGGFIAKRYRK